jgi:hypothetical protein
VKISAENGNEMAVSVMAKMAKTWRQQTRQRCVKYRAAQLARPFAWRKTRRASAINNHLAAAAYQQA